MVNYSEYANACIINGLFPSKLDFLQVNHNDPSEEEKRLMQSMVDIHTVVSSLAIIEAEKNIFTRKFNNEPFKGLSLQEYILKHGRKGVYEVRIYLTALRAYSLAMGELPKEGDTK